MLVFSEIAEYIDETFERFGDVVKEAKLDKTKTISAIDCLTKWALISLNEIIDQKDIPTESMVKAFVRRKLLDDGTVVIGGDPSLWETSHKAPGTVDRGEEFRTLDSFSHTLADISDPLLSGEAYKELRSQAISKATKKETFRKNHEHIPNPLTEDESIDLSVFLCVTQDMESNIFLTSPMNGDYPALLRLRDNKMDVHRCNEYDKGKVTYIISYQNIETAEEWREKFGLHEMVDKPLPDRAPGPLLEEESFEVSSQVFPAPSKQNHYFYRDEELGIVDYAKSLRSFYDALKSAREKNYFIVRRDSAPALVLGFIEVRGNGSTWHMLPFSVYTFFRDGQINWEKWDAKYKEEKERLDILMKESIEL